MVNDRFPPAWKIEETRRPATNGLDITSLRTGRTLRLQAPRDHSTLFKLYFRTR